MQPMMGMNPVVSPELIVAAASAVMEAIQTWRTLRDWRAASRAAILHYEEARRSPKVAVEAQAIINLVPISVLEGMVQRVNTCWKRYSDMIYTEDQYLPGELDSATEAVKQCICRELRRMYSLNRRIPAGILQQYWQEYCGGQ